MFDYLKGMGKKLTSKTRAWDEAEDYPLSPHLSDNVHLMKELFRNDNDFVVREFVIPLSGEVKAACFFIDGLANGSAVSDSILAPLMIDSRLIQRGNIPMETITDITDHFLLSGEIKVEQAIAAACEACLMGDTVLMVDGFDQFVYFNTKGFEKRSVSEPQTETVVRGPREGFTEVLRVNTSLLRRKLKTPHLRMETMTIGKRSRSLICLTYLDDIANPELIEEVRRRLRTVDIDAVLNSGYIDECIEDAPASVFQTINYTEKPDIVAAKLLEGRCAVIIDGTPFVLTMPMFFVESFQSAEDYAIRSVYAFALRIVRLIGFFLSLAAPAVYVALVTFHQELLPTPLLFTIAAASEDLPFPCAIETAIMLLTFEIIKEAGVRLPKPVGQAVSIVGALVMGQAAIEAGVVGAPVVIVIAFAAVSSFLAPTAADATSILRWYLLILASFLGGFGIAVGLMTILIHLASLESFGSAYLYPLAPFRTSGLKDTIVRAPLWKMHTRPTELHPQDLVRENTAKPDFGKEGEA